MSEALHAPVRAALARGDALAAATLADALLAQDPRDAEALHLRGLAHTLAGDTERAVADLAAACALRPDDAVQHSNRAEALRRAGRFDDAVRAAQRALALRHDYPAAWSNLAAAQFASGAHAAAAESFARWLALSPGEPAAHAGHGDCLRELGDVRGARRAYEQALALDPRHAHAHANLGPLLLLLGEVEPALAHCRTAVELSPRSATAHMNLGLCRAGLEQLDDAMDAFAQAWELQPSALLACNISAVWQATGEVAQAASWLDRAEALEPGRLGTRCAAAELMLEHGQAARALEEFATLAGEAPSLYEAHSGHARALWEDGDADGAVAAFARAAALRPQYAAVHAAIGEVLASAGDMAAAEAAFRTGLAINPRSVPALAGLGTTLRGKLPQADLTHLRAQLVAPWLSQTGRGALHAALAHCCDARGEHAEAAAHMAQANAQQRASLHARGLDYDAAAHERHVDALLDTFTPALFERLRDSGVADERPVFVVGMPRSGTTLTEQILACHPRVLGIGERPYAQRALHALGGDDALAALREVDAGAIAHCARAHLLALDALIDKAQRTADGVLRVVDKMPDNYQLLGWIAVMFPNARIVHVRRDPRDIALSCWMQRFGSIRWANDTGDIAGRLIGHDRLMRHWRAVLPLPIHEVEYESLVADQEGESRRLVAAIGLEWDPACLAFHRSERLVRTASVSQVRQPIYRGSVARWRHYEAILKPVIERLRAAGIPVAT